MIFLRYQALEFFRSKFPNSLILKLEDVDKSYLVLKLSWLKVLDGSETERRSNLSAPSEFPLRSDSEDGDRSDQVFSPQFFPVDGRHCWASTEMLPFHDI